MVQRRKRLLDVDLIVDTAIACVDEYGRLTMGELAARLGSSASSIYHHVSGRSAIIELIRERLAARVAPPPLDGTDWGTQVAGWMHAYRRGLAAHPALIPLLVEQPITAAPALEGFDRIAALLASAGMPADELILWITVLDSYVIGAALDLTAPPDVWDGQGGTKALEAAVHAGPRGEPRADAAFELGVAVLVAGLRDRLRSSADASS